MEGSGKGGVLCWIKCLLQQCISFSDGDYGAEFPDQHRKHICNTFLGLPFSVVA